ncbi:MAG TPA: HEAT repeat domain-containing protein [Thermomicrobiaceae bacterium]|nr:HEAT repeat domain-containing protein [Thermomicrobiaceae bacterium]
MRRPTSAEIVGLLEQPVEDRRPIVHRIEQQARIRDLIAALRIATIPLTREILINILGNRHSKTAVPVLLDALVDPCRRVRVAAATALRNIPSPAVGSALLARFENEEDLGVKAWIASALGGVGYDPAIPHLIPALASNHRGLRYLAAWSLGALRAAEAEGAIEQALTRESDAEVQKRMREALGFIREGQD